MIFLCTAIVIGNGHIICNVFLRFLMIYISTTWIFSKRTKKKIAGLQNWKCLETIFHINCDTFFDEKHYLKNLSLQLNYHNNFFEVFLKHSGKYFIQYWNILYHCNISLKAKSDSTMLVNISFPNFPTRVPSLSTSSFNDPALDDDLCVNIHVLLF